MIFYIYHLFSLITWCRFRRSRVLGGFRVFDRRLTKTFGKLHYDQALCAKKVRFVSNLDPSRALIRRDRTRR